MAQETSLGQGPSRFPSTVWEVLEKVRGPADPRAELNALAERYWRPVYRFIRVVWKKPVEDAKDLTQEFFATVFDREFLQTADRARGNFRQFVLASLRNFLAGHRRAETAIKRGGDRLVFSMDAGADLDGLEPADPAAGPEEAFDRAWAAEILRRAVARLEQEYDATGRRVQFETFRRHSLADGPGPSYRDIARDLGIGEFDVGNYLVAARKDLRRHCRDLVQETLGDPGRVDEEMAALFGPPS